MMLLSSLRWRDAGEPAQEEFRNIVQESYLWESALRKDTANTSA
jgi:hypothetical protein